MKDLLFDNPIVFVVIGVVLFVILVLFLVSKKNSKKNTSVNSINEFNSVPELDQINKEVKPFSEQDFNRQLMSQVQGVSVETPSIEVKAPVAQTADSVPNLVPEFNQGVISNVNSEAVQPQVQVNSQPQPDIFAQPPIISSEEPVIDIIETNEEPQIVNSDEVFGQNISNQDSSESIDIIE